MFVYKNVLNIPVVKCVDILSTYYNNGHIL